MKRLWIGICCTLLLCLTGISFAAEKDSAVMAKETLMWDLIKQGDLKTFSSNLADSMIEIEPDGRIFTKTEMMLNLEKFHLESFSLSDMKVEWINDNTALVTSKANVKGTLGEQQISGDFRCSSLWVKQGKNWIGRFHQETPVAPMPMTDKQ